VLFDAFGRQAVDLELLMQIEGHWNKLDDIKALATIGVTPFEVVDKRYKLIQPIAAA